MLLWLKALLAQHRDTPAFNQNWMMGSMPCLTLNDRTDPVQLSAVCSADCMFLGGSCSHHEPPPSPAPFPKYAMRIRFWLLASLLSPHSAGHLLTGK